ncbi:MAG: BCCT family transporter [Desulfovibrio sp.]
MKKCSACENSLDHIPFCISFLAMVIFIVFAILSPGDFTQYFDTLQNWITCNFGWLSIFLSLCIVLFALGVIFSPIGAIRIGGKDAKPDFSLWKWFTISLCAGIGIGILFWGIGEPIFHLMSPPKNLGLEPGSYQAGVFAISQSILHWSVAQYAMYAICGVAFALSAYNKGLPLSIFSGLKSLVPDHYASVSRCVLHIICIFSLSCAVISSMGSLILMISSCVAHLTGLERTILLNASICILAMSIYTVSAALGLKKGMAFMSKWCTRIFIFIMMFVFLVGPTLFILNMGTEAFGYFLDNFFHNSTLVSTEFLPDHWSELWLIIYMAAFFGYAAPIGLFLARLGKGRTVRQFLLMNIFAPTVFVYFWVNTFGSMAIYFQWKDIMDVWAFVQSQGLESTVVAILKNFPMGYVLIVLFTLASLISFVTLADPMTTVLATLSTKGTSVEDEAPLYLKIIWGITIGLAAILLLATTGLSGLRGMFALGGLLLMFITVAICFSIVKMTLPMLKRPQQL